MTSWVITFLLRKISSTITCGYLDENAMVRKLSEQGVEGKNKWGGSRELSKPDKEEKHIFRRIV